MVRTLHFHCRGPRFDPWLGTKILPTSQATGQPKKKKKNDISGIQVFKIDSSSLTTFVGSSALLSVPHHPELRVFP